MQKHIFVGDNVSNIFLYDRRVSKIERGLYLKKRISIVNYRLQINKDENVHRYAKENDKEKRERERDREREREGERGIER